MAPVNTFWGTALWGVSSLTSSPATVDMNGAATGVGWSFTVPKSGTITDIGCLITTVGGTPPAYNAILRTLDASTGAPASGTNYGGSTTTSFTPTAVGWRWITLGTAATATAGDFAAVTIVPGGTAPTGTNYISVSRGSVTALGTIWYYPGTWLQIAGGGPFAVRYSDGSVYGYAAASDSRSITVRSNTTPDEVGCKFTLPAAMTVYGARIHAATGSWGTAAAIDVVLYDGANSVVASASVSDKDYVDDNSAISVFWGAVNLSANTTYRLVIKPTVGTNGDVVVFRYQFDSADARAAFPCGADWQYTSRTDAGTWTDSSTELIPMNLWVSDIDFSGGTVTTIFEGGPQSAEFPSSNFPALTPVNGRVALAFDASTDEACYWTFVCPQGGIGTSLTCIVYYAMASATSGAVYWQAALEAVTPGDSLDLDATTSFDTANSGSGTVPGTAGYMQAITITMTNKDSIAAGDLVWLKLNRDADNASDNATGDAYVYRVELRSA